jgi:hypothetical protein
MAARSESDDVHVTAESVTADSAPAAAGPLVVTRPGYCAHNGYPFILPGTYPYMFSCMQHRATGGQRSTGTGTLGPKKRPGPAGTQVQTAVQTRKA